MIMKGTDCPPPLIISRLTASAAMPFQSVLDLLRVIIKDVDGSY